MSKAKRYGSTNIEEASILESAKCREILNEILDFGVNQAQIITLIKLLSLELESRSLMLKIVNAVEDKNETEISKPTITIWN